jgi:MerR family transcriptional regulator, heat shock protein HspR
VSPRDESGRGRGEGRGRPGSAGAKRDSGGARERAESIDREQGVFMISVAAELADMHPQTLRMYENRGLIRPKRSPKNTRLYSQEDVERLRRIQMMTAEEGLNLAGVETVLTLERKLDEMRDELERVRKRALQLERRMAEEIERARRSLRSEIVPYGAYEGKLGPAQGPTRVRIPVERKRRGHPGG